MPVDSTLFMVCGAAILVALVTAALLSVRAIDGMVRIIREKQPGDWKLWLLDSFRRGDATSPRQVFWGWWIFDLIVGLRRLDLPDEDYHALLRAARWRLGASLL